MRQEASRQTGVCVTLGPPVLAGAGAGATGVPAFAATGAGAGAAGAAAAGAGAAAAGAWAAGVGVGAGAAGACCMGAVAGAGSSRVLPRRTLRTGDELAERRGAALAAAGAMGAALATGADPPPREVRFAVRATRCVRTMFGAADRPTCDAELPVAAAAVVPAPAALDGD
jgi:hypothetical protein